MRCFATGFPDTLADPQKLCKKALLCGYYGEHNIGDDALLAALLQQLPSDWTPLVTAYDQAELEQRFGVATRIDEARELEQLAEIDPAAANLDIAHGTSVTRS